MSCSRQPHVVFHDDHVWTEGGGAKWRFVKYGLWLTLRLRQLVGSEDVQWLPNPAQMQNPQMSRRRPSMMGALGIVQPTAPPPVLANRSAAWLGERVRLGEYRRVNLELHPTENSGAERKALAAIADTSDPRPLAFYAVGPSQPMHWHGSAGAWLHHCFFLHRKRRSRRAAGANGGASERGGTLLELDRWLPRGAYLVGVHVRDFTAAASAEWNLPASYYAGLVAAVFNATPLSCANTRIVVLGPPGNPAVEQLSQSFECATVEARLTIEIHSSPQEDPTAGDDYTPEDDDDDAVRGYVFRDLELMGLSDVLITSNSEFSGLAQSLSSPQTIVLCPPRRPGKDNRGLPCDQTGVPNSILTQPNKWGARAVASSDVDVDHAHVLERLGHLWGTRGDLPLSSQPHRGIHEFDHLAPVEASWPQVVDEYRAYQTKEFRGSAYLGN